jgi:hypothetical protein
MFNIKNIKNFFNNIFYINVIYIIIFLIIIYIVYLIKKYDSSKLEEKKDKLIYDIRTENINFFRPIDVFNKLNNIEFFNNLNDKDLKVRNVINTSEYKTIIKINLKEFTNKEKNILIKLINNIDKKINKYKKLKDIEWNLIKINYNIENGLAHTHKNIIFLPESFFINPNENTLLHELLHIYQRNYRIKTIDFYKKFYFKIIDKDKYFLINNNNNNKLVKISDELKSIELNKRNNPDLYNYFSFNNLYFYSKYTDNPNNLNDIKIKYYNIVDNKIGLDIIKKLDNEHSSLIKDYKDNNYKYEEIYQKMKKSKDKVNARENFDSFKIESYLYQDNVENHLSYDNDEIRTEFNTISPVVLNNLKDKLQNKFNNKEINKKFLDSNQLYYDESINKFNKNKNIIELLKRNGLQVEHPNEIFAILIAEFILNNYNNNLVELNNLIKLFKLLNKKFVKEDIENLILNYLN